MDEMCAEIFDDKYYLSFIEKNKSYTHYMITYDLKTGVILYYNYIARLFLKTQDKLKFIRHGNDHIESFNYDSWALKTNYIGGEWVSPWIDFGYKRIQKGGFDLYFTPEVQLGPVTLSISIQTEKKTKTKTRKRSRIRSWQHIIRRHPWTNCGSVLTS